MKQQTFIKEFNDYDSAFEYQNRKNMACKRAGNTNDIFAVVPGAELPYAVVDLTTAIELELGYVFSGSSTSYVNNPFYK